MTRASSGLSPTGAAAPSGHAGPTRLLGIVSALPEELAAILEMVEAPQTSVVAGRRLHRGHLQGHEVVLTLSGMGKVATALTTTLLIERFGVGGKARWDPSVSRTTRLALSRATMAMRLTAAARSPRTNVHFRSCA